MLRCEKDLENRELKKLDQETAKELKGNEGTPDKFSPGEPKVAKRLMRDLFMGPDSPFGHPYHAKVAMEQYIETADGHPFWISEGEVRGYEDLDVERADLVIRWIAENFKLKSDTDAHVHLSHAVEGEENADSSPSSSYSQKNTKGGGKDMEFDEEKISKCFENRAKNDFDVEVANTFLEEYHSDQDWGWHHLIERYLDGTDRELIDSVFIDLCGWSFSTLLEKAHSKLVHRNGPKVE